MEQSTIYKPNLGRFSRVTFWDTDITNIDWIRHADFVIERVFGYGTADEQDYLLSFYGPKRIRRFAESFHPSPYNRNTLSNLRKILPFYPEPPAGNVPLL